MIKALEIIAKNPEKYEKLNESKKELFLTMSAKFCIEIKSKVDVEEIAEDKITKEENIEPNNSVIEKSSCCNDSKVKETNLDKQSNLKEHEPENSEGNNLLGYKETNQENIINEVNNKDINDNNTLSSLNNKNSQENNNKSHLSSIKEEKEVLSNSFKNSSEEVVYPTSNERNINNFINNQKETTMNSNNIVKNGNHERDVNHTKQINSINSAIKTNDSISKDKPHENASSNKHKKRLTIVDSKAQDDIDEKLDNFLINIYNKKKMSFIPMRRVSENYYEFGSQKIEIKIDDEIIRGIYKFRY